MNVGTFMLAFSLLAVPLMVYAPASPTTLVVIPSGSSANQGSPAFTPNTVTVVVGVNNTVLWTNNDSAAHTVTQSSEPPTASWNGSGNINPGQSYQFTFTVPGTYTYACSYHTWMRGTVIVKAGSAVPEFPAGSLAIVLLAVVVGAVFAMRRFSRPSVGRFSQARL